MRVLCVLRCSSLVLALTALVPALIASASAQSAWLLWNETKDTILPSSENRAWLESHTWTVIMAGPTQARCEAEVAWAVEQCVKDRAEYEKAEVKGNTVLITSHSAEGNLITATIHRFVCFPDTRDPRGN